MNFLKLIQEGRVDDFKIKYSQKFGGENINKIVSSVPQKYLDWVGNNLDIVNFDDTFDKVSKALNKFKKISSNLPVTDLIQYKSVEQLLSAISKYESRQRRNVKKVEGGNVVYDDGRYFVVNPLTHEASCYYGKGTKWCTSAEADTHFKRYNDDGKLFYILDRTLPTNEPFYKVALLRKFDGDKTYYDAKDDTIKSGWIYNTNELKEILSSVDDYLNVEYAEQIKIFADKEAAKKERDRIERLRIQRVMQDRREESQERRLNGDWALGPDCPEVGLKAHALLNWLIDNNDVEAITNKDRGEIARIQNEIDRLQSEDDINLLDEINELEDELDGFTSKIDVYNIVPTGEFYDTTEFEVIDSSDVETNRYAVGTEDEMKSSAYESIDQLIDDIGYEGFNESFTKGYIDEQEVIRYAENLFDDDVRENPESYIDEEDRLLSRNQEEKIEQFKIKINQLESMIERFESEMDGDNDDDIQERIDEINERIEELKDEITEIEENPEGDFSEEKIEEAIESRLIDVKNDVTGFMEDFGLNWEDYIDKNEFIEGIIETDGYGPTLNGYDGNADDTRVQNQLFYVMRLD